MTFWTSSFSTTTTTNLSITSNWIANSSGTGSYTINYNPKIAKRVRNGKYQVRCRSCSRWARVIYEKPGAFGPIWKVHCVRCFGENDGFSA